MAFETPQTMQIATFNVNSVNARLPNILAWLKEASPDVVCLQELKCEAVKFPQEALEDLGYNCACVGQKSYNGVAILSKTPLEIACTQLPGEPEDSQARYLEAEISHNGGVVRVACLYCPNGNPIGTEKFDYKLRWRRGTGTSFPAQPIATIPSRGRAMLCFNHKAVPRGSACSIWG